MPTVLAQSRARLRACGIERIATPAYAPAVFPGAGPSYILDSPHVAIGVINTLTGRPTDVRWSREGTSIISAPDACAYAMPAMSLCALDWPARGSSPCTAPSTTKVTLDTAEL